MRGKTIKTLLEYDETIPSYKYEDGQILLLNSLILTTHSSSLHDNNDEVSICALRNEQFTSRPQINKHYKTNPDCDLFCNLSKHSLLKCPNDNCNTWRNNDKELQKHTQYHCHRTDGEKEFYNLNIESATINRKLTKHMGIPGSDHYIKR